MTKIDFTVQKLSISEQQSYIPSYNAKTQSKRQSLRKADKMNTHSSFDWFTFVGHGCRAAEKLDSGLSQEQLSSLTPHLSSLLAFFHPASSSSSVHTPRRAPTTSNLTMSRPMWSCVFLPAAKIQPLKWPLIPEKNKTENVLYWTHGSHVKPRTEPC